MRRIFYSRFGGPEVLQFEQMDVPMPAPGQVRIRVAGIGLNPIDFKTRRGLGFVSQSLGQRFHFVPGYDVSGVIDAVGEGVNERAVGSPVFGMVNFPLGAGAYADYVVVNLNECVPAPQAIPLAHAAALPLAGLTAWQALFDVGQLKAGERVLVLAGAGGVGHLATQLARWKGAVVGATASSANQAFLRRHGVKQALDYQQPDWATSAAPWQLILDLVGGEVGLQAMAGLADTGRMVTVPTNTAAQLVEQGQALGKTVLPMKVSVHPDQLRQIGSLIDHQHLHLHISGAFSLDEAATAQEQLETGRTKGKLILVP